MTFNDTVDQALQEAKEDDRSGSERRRSSLERRGGSIERRGSSLERKSSIERRTSTERRRGSLKKVLHHSASHVSPSFRLFMCLSTFILSYFVSVTPVAVPRCLGRR